MAYLQTTEPVFEHSIKSLRRRAVTFCRLALEDDDGAVGATVIAEARTFEAFLAAGSMAIDAVTRREDMLGVVQSLRPGLEAKEQVQWAEMLLRYVEEG